MVLSPHVFYEGTFNNTVCRVKEYFFEYFISSDFPQNTNKIYILWDLTCTKETIFHQDNFKLKIKITQAGTLV